MAAECVTCETSIDTDETYCRTCVSTGRAEAMTYDVTTGRGWDVDVDIVLVVSDRSRSSWLASE